MNRIYYNDIIIGAGPAGLQLGYYFKKMEKNYIILEKTNFSGSFFDKYPLSSKLISINKRFTGNNNSEFNMRHDWNSLINDEDFLFKNYSNEYYPDSSDLHKYLNDFSIKNELNIKYNTNIVKIVKVLNNNDYNYEIYIENNNEDFYICKNLICATGLSKPKVPEINMVVHDKIKHYGDFNKDYFKNPDNLKKYENKIVLLIGGGNASYELANILNNYCASVIILGSRKDLALVTHYTGDIRSIYLPFLDTFHLKSLNGIDNLDKSNLKSMTIIQKKDEPYNNRYQLLLKGAPYYGNKQLEYFDEIIFCTGWSFDSSIFDFPIKLSHSKFPEIKYNFESSENKNLYFIGSIMHSLDYKKSSGGFIHGFRYLIKLFIQMNYSLNYDIKKFKFDGTMNCYKELALYIHNRINTSSALYQMYGVLCDVFYFDNENKEIVYYNQITMNVAMNLIKKQNINVLKLVYGDKNYDIKKLGDFNKFNPSFLHPEISIFQKECDIDNYKFVDKIIFEEDIVADFRCIDFLNKIKRTLYGCPLIL